MSGFNQAQKKELDSGINKITLFLEITLDPQPSADNEEDSS